MGVPMVYRKSGEGTISSYNYVDIAEGTGIVGYLAYSHRELTTLAYSMSTESLYSQTIYTEANVSSGATTPYKALDIDFDLVFNKPQSIRGKARFIIPHNTGSASTGNVICYQYVTIKIRKWDGTTETEIASATGESHAGNYLVILQFLDNIEVNIPNVTHFKKGETLRVTIEVYCDAPIGSNGAIARLSHDPKDRITGVPQDEGGVPYTTQLQFFIPYILDL
jgi:hypothetical protein